MKKFQRFSTTAPTDRLREVILAIDADKAKAKARDPREDPHVGDAIYKVSEATGKKHSRTVVKRVDNDITYRDQNGKERVCWITTWMEWARTAEVAVSA